MLVNRWSTVYNVEPMRHWFNVLCLLGFYVMNPYSQQTQLFKTILFQWWVSVVEGGPIFDKHWFKFMNSMFILHYSNWVCAKASSYELSIFIHLKLRVAVARHNFELVNIGLSCINMIKGKSSIGTMHLMYAFILLYIISYAIENIKHDMNEIYSFERDMHC